MPSAASSSKLQRARPSSASIRVLAPPPACAAARCCGDSARARCRTSRGGSARLRSPDERQRVLHRLPAVRALADSLHVTRAPRSVVDVAQQAVQVGQLTQQCILTAIVQPGASPQDADRPRQRLDGRRRLPGCVQRIREARRAARPSVDVRRPVALLRHAWNAARAGSSCLLDAPRGIGRRERNDQCQRMSMGSPRKHSALQINAKPRRSPAKLILEYSAISRGAFAMWIRKIERDLKKGVDSPMPTQVGVERGVHSAPADASGRSRSRT